MVGIYLVCVIDNASIFTMARTPQATPDFVQGEFRTHRMLEPLYQHSLLQILHPNRIHSTNTDSIQNHSVSEFHMLCFVCEGHEIFDVYPYRNCHFHGPRVALAEYKLPDSNGRYKGQYMTLYSSTQDGGILSCDVIPIYILFHMHDQRKCCDFCIVFCCKCQLAYRGNMMLLSSLNGISCSKKENTALVGGVSSFVENPKFKRQAFAQRGFFNDFRDWIDSQPVIQSVCSYLPSWMSLRTDATRSAQVGTATEHTILSSQDSAQDFTKCATSELVEYVSTHSNVDSLGDHDDRVGLFSWAEREVEISGRLRGAGIDGLYWSYAVSPLWRMNGTFENKPTRVDIELGTQYCGSNLRADFRAHTDPSPSLKIPIATGSLLYSPGLGFTAGCDFRLLTNQGAGDMSFAASCMPGRRTHITAAILMDRASRTSRPMPLSTCVSASTGFGSFDFSTELHWDISKSPADFCYMLGMAYAKDSSTCIKLKTNAHPNADRQISCEVVKRLADHVYFSLGSQISHTSDVKQTIDNFFDNMGVRLTFR